MALAHGISVFVWMLFFDIQKVMVSSSSSDHGLQTLIWDDPILTWRVFLLRILYLNHIGPKDNSLQTAWSWSRRRRNFSAAGAAGAQLETLGRSPSGEKICEKHKLWKNVWLALGIQKIDSVIIIGQIANTNWFTTARVIVCFLFCVPQWLGFWGSQKRKDLGRSTEIDWYSQSLFMTVVENHQSFIGSQAKNN